MDARGQGRLLALLRQSLHFSLEDTASAVGLEPHDLARLEDGWSYPRPYYRRLAWALGQEYAQLLLGTWQTEASDRWQLRQQYRAPGEWCSLSIWFATLDWFAQHIPPWLPPTPVRLPFGQPQVLYHHRHYGLVELLDNPQGPFRGTAAWLPLACEQEVVQRLRAGRLGVGAARRVLLLDEVEG